MSESPYRCQTLGFLTQHGKERVIAPILEPALGCTVVRVDGYDTDQLGSFTRDRPRIGAQRDAALRKAQIGMALSGLRFGLGSEGSFGPDPFTGLLTWNVEMLVLVDQRLGIEVTGVAQGYAMAGSTQTADWEAARAFAMQHGFPDQHLVARPDHPDDPRIMKGLADWERLRTAFERCRAQARNSQVFIETDLRAQASPSRMARIAEAAKDLLARLQSACPTCHCPGFWVTAREPGLQCAGCGLPTRVWRSERWACLRCAHQSVSPRSDRHHAEPRECSFCNP